MVEIMAHLQQYVPAKEYIEEAVVEGTEGCSLNNALLHPLLFGSDQLTAARGRGAKKIRDITHGSLRSTS